MNKNNIKKQEIKREEKIIFFGTNEMFDNLANPDIKQYFIDITYKNIPNFYKPYKLLTIKGFNLKKNYSILFGLAWIKFEDEQSLKYKIKYLNDVYNLNPLIINIDYSLLLNKAILNNDIFLKKPIFINCFFHFCQILIRKMKNLKMKFNKTNSKIFIIAKNIEIICFLKPELIKIYLAHLKDNLNNNIKDKSL